MSHSYHMLGTDKHHRPSMSVDTVKEILSEGLVERWSFPKCEYIESIEAHYKPKPKTRNIAGELFKLAKQYKRKSNADPEKPNPIPKTKSILYWILSLKDPVSCLFADNKDKYNIAVDTMLNVKTSEICAKLEFFSDHQIYQYGHNEIPKRRPVDVTKSILALKDPKADIQGKDRWAAVAVCNALDVGLIKETESFADVLCWNDVMGWVKNDEIETYSKEDATKRLFEKATDLILNTNPPMNSLRECCVCLGVTRPLKKSRVGLIEQIQEKLTSAKET